MEDPSTTIHLDSSGGLRLLIKDKEQRWMTLVVSSSAMCLASPVWRAMLDPKGHFKEAKEREVEFPEDDLDALLIILCIAHLRFRQLPESVTFRGLVNLAVVCDKYDTVAIVRKWLPEWLAPWYEHDLSSGYEEWLSIAWTTGDFVKFQKLTKHLVLSCDINSAGKLCHLGKLLTISIVPNVIEQIIKAREVLITALLEVCTKLVDRYHTEKLVCWHVAGRESILAFAEIGKECDTIVYGSLVRGLEPMGIWPSISTSSNIRMSASDVMRRLKSIHCYNFRESPPFFFDHSKCGFTAELEKEVDRIVEHVLPLAMDVAIDESYRKHMEEQARK